MSHKGQSQMENTNEVLIAEDSAGTTETFMQKAEKAADIVSTSVANGDYSDISRKLDDMSEVADTSSQYVYRHEKNVLTFAQIAICAILGVLFAYFFVIYAGTALYSQTYRWYGMAGMLCSLAIIAVNIFFVYMAIAYLKFCNRYNKYQAVLKYRKIEIVDDLVEYSGNTYDVVIDDLNKAVKRKLIPQGHFGTDNIIFIPSDEMYEKYKEKQAVYDRYYQEQLKERKRMSERTAEMQEILDSGQRHIKKIHEYNDIIKDKGITRKLDRMEEIVKMIFLEVDKEPGQSGRLGLLLNYYLPTTEKLLEAYIDLDEKSVKDKTIAKTQKDIDDALDIINNSFEKILGGFYQEIESDVATDIKTMETMIEQEEMI